MPSEEQFKTITLIVMKLAQLGYEVTFVEPITTGPLVTTYRFTPRAAAKVAQITSCAQDLALALSVEDVLVRRIPGEAVIGVSIPNATRELVYWRKLCGSPDATMLLPLNLGVDSQGKLFRDDLTKLPHLLIAGSTNGGKSCLLHGLVASLMLWLSPEQVQFIISDTKNVEFGQFIGAPHLLCDPVVSMYTTWEKMDWLIVEIERRLKVIGSWECRNVIEYHTKNKQHQMPYIVLVIDELADVLGGEKRGEATVATAKLGRIVQKSRAAGVHVIAATQRPSVNIVSGSIKANFPSRLTFKLPSEADSRTVIGTAGAEHLLGCGDMLYQSTSYPGVRRLHSGYATTVDIRAVVEMAKLKHQMQTR